LGGDGFLHKLKDQWNQRVERPKNNGQKKNWSAVGAEQILERVSEHFQSDLERLKERSIRNNLARRCAITLCWVTPELRRYSVCPAAIRWPRRFGEPRPTTFKL
jgi:hypothetical protein